MVKEDFEQSDAEPFNPTSLELKPKTQQVEEAALDMLLIEPVWN